QTTLQLNAPFQDPALEPPQEIEVTDPTHPLFGQRFTVLSMATTPASAGNIIVSYHNSMRLRIPRTSTSLMGTRQTTGVKLTLAAVTELVTLANEHFPCLLHPKSFGSGCRRRASKPSSTNSRPSSRR
ncbi:MAG: hypothetical protein KDJ99_00915, partial [Candidatus Competibacteraceae bacterium]|nr:hypothetical protein [Candidatus Competibacteraceae bacterium]